MAMCRVAPDQSVPGPIFTCAGGFEPVVRRRNIRTFGFILFITRYATTFVAALQITGRVLQDLVAVLAHSGKRICMAVLEVVGFNFDNEKGTRTIVPLKGLKVLANKIKISGQIIDLSASASSSSWVWTKDYVALNASPRDNKLTHHQFVIQVPSCLAHPLAPTIAAKSVSNFQLDASCYPT
ncbi:hypothetical protein FIBSPDRAFT_904039 [Athelia psychrophila]|uniref:Uncharacterized protein n=1 Tax=Athelia psychrophila TaxID=1759441 RepID=A0A167V8I7_9AGAM|nr:hypothetical protein FIBSPDRAFT_904039 [Fibularhizoctonia sp. CBS 109695]